MSAGCGATGPEGYRCTGHRDGEHVAQGVHPGSVAEVWPIVSGHEGAARTAAMRGEARRLRVLEFEAQTLENEAHTLENRALRLADEAYTLRRRSRALNGSASLVRERSGITTSLLHRATALEAEATELEEHKS